MSKAIAGTGAKVYRDEINKAFQEFITSKAEGYDHIKSIWSHSVLIELFAIECKQVKGLFIAEDNSPGLVSFVFPVGRIIKSGHEMYNEGDIIGINPTLTWLQIHPEWVVWGRHKNNEPQPEMPKVPRETWPLDFFDTGWPQKRFIDPINPLAMKRVYQVTIDEIKIVYDKTNPDFNNLNSYIDAEL